MTIAIIGAGIMGLYVACEATKQGFDVTLYEKQAEFPTNASSIAGGMLAPFSEIEALPLPYIDEGLRAIGIWCDLLQSTDIFKQTGSLLIAHQEDRHMLHRFAQHLENVADEWAWQNVKEIEPDLDQRFGQGITIQSEAYLEPHQTMKFLFDQFTGKIVREHVDPEDLKGTYDWVIDCRGYVQGMDDARGVKGEILLIENNEFTLNRPVRMMHPRYPLYIIPRESNVFAVGASVIENGDDSDDRVLLRSAMELMSAAYSLHPSFGEAHIIDIQSAVRPAYNDNLPRITQTDRNVIRCNGLFRHGYLFAPIMAESVLNRIKGKKDQSALFWHETTDEVRHAS